MEDYTTVGALPQRIWNCGSDCIVKRLDLINKERDLLANYW